jgi:hypothetical protein
LDVTTEERHHVALPKLYGASATPQRPKLVAHSPRPFDPDDLPIEAEQTEEERELTQTLPPRAYVAGGGFVLGPGEGGAGSEPAAHEAPDERPRELSIRSIAGRFLGGPTSRAS